MTVLTILTQPVAPINLTDTVIAYLQAQGEAAITPIFVEAMCSELEQVARLTGDTEFTDAELRYAYMIAADEPVGFDDLPTALWP